MGYDFNVVIINAPEDFLGINEFKSGGKFMSKSTLLLLPDFIGHPACFLKLISHLQDTSYQLINYHQYWPYENIPHLAQKILADMEFETGPRWMLGYSFGGLVAYEIFKWLSADNTRLMLVDTHLSLKAEKPLKIPEEIKLTIEALIEIGEIKEECIAANLNFFQSYLPSFQHSHLPSTILIQSNLDSAIGIKNKSTSEWKKYISKIERHQTKTSHFEMMRDEKTLNLIMNIIGAKHEYL